MIAAISVEILFPNLDQKVCKYNIEMLSFFFLFFYDIASGSLNVIFSLA